MKVDRTLVRKNGYKLAKNMYNFQAYFRPIYAVLLHIFAHIFRQMCIFLFQNEEFIYVDF